MSTKIRWTNADEMDVLVQDALDNPRVGDVFHEHYSFGIEVTEVTDTDVAWRSFNTGPVDQGRTGLDEWRLEFRYGDHMPGQHIMHLLERGDQ